MKPEEEILQQAGVHLPVYYMQYLSSNGFEKTVSIFEDQEDYGIYTLNELAEKVTIDEMEVLTAQMLSAYAHTLAELTGDDTYDQNGDAFSLDRLAKSIVIGMSNTDILFLDAHDHESLCVFHPDGGDVTLTDKTLRKTIQN